MKQALNPIRRRSVTHCDVHSATALVGISLQFSHYCSSQDTHLGVTDVYISFFIIDYNMSIMAPGISLAWVREDAIKRRQTHK